ncbi:hypothetical protein V2S66_24725 [Streptomyces sp. V4-01]|uniref:Uncharacterized protein n=1 Tax=Actinacidiphila polyblastidii TaxID=3110430 RepID=A0ABU7PH60_9ACTN|nr:hypothetical protein [Streptomyces sp. V4-01]
MSRLLRYFLVWLSCTAVTVTAVFLTVRYVVHSTAPMPPTARALPIAPGGGTLAPITTSPSPSPSPSRTTTPKPKASPSHRATPSRPAPTPRKPSATPSADCRDGGVGAQTVHSQGGQVTARWGAEAVCLVSAVPAPGFTTQTAQHAPDELVVTFSGSHHRSQITATLHPQPKAAISEVSW